MGHAKVIRGIWCLEKMQYIKPPTTSNPITIRGKFGFEVSKKIGNQLLIQVAADAKDAQITFERVLRVEINNHLDRLLEEFEDKVQLARSQAMEATNFKL